MYVNKNSHVQHMQSKYERYASAICQGVKGSNLESGLFQLKNEKLEIILV